MLRQCIQRARVKGDGGGRRLPYCYHLRQSFLSTLPSFDNDDNTNNNNINITNINNHQLSISTSTSSFKVNKISLSLKSQIKMALHATKYGYSTPIHGIVLGKSNTDGSLEIVDVVPVCHEVPTKPIVDMALRLTDAYLQQQQERGLKIIGWYTANSSNRNNNSEELPNSSACRIASFIAEIDEDGGDNIVLLLVSTSKLVSSMTKQTGTDKVLPIICNIYEKSSHRTFTQQVNEDRMISSDSLKEGGGNFSTAVEQCLSSLGDADAAGGGGGGGKNSGIAIYDYVDHLNDGGRGDWIVNDTVNKFVSG